MTEEMELQSPELAQEQDLETHRDNGYLLAVIDRCLDKGVVIDDWTSVRVLGLEVLTVDVHSLVASFEKYLEYAGSVELTMHRLELDNVEREPLPLP